MTFTADIDISARWRGLGIAVLSLVLANGCGALNPTASPAPASFYSLDLAGSRLAATLRPAKEGAPTLLITPPRVSAASGLFMCVRPTSLNTFRITSG